MAWAKVILTIFVLLTFFIGISFSVSLNYIFHIFLNVYHKFKKQELIYILKLFQSNARALHKKKRKENKNEENE